MRVEGSVLELFVSICMSRAPAEGAEVFLLCWFLLTYPAMVYHVSGLQLVPSLDRECASTVVA